MGKDAWFGASCAFMLLFKALFGDSDSRIMIFRAITWIFEIIFV